MQTNITNNLIDRSLAAQAQQFQNAMAANEGIGRAYNQGMATLGQGGNFGMNAGGFLQAQEQARLAAQQAAFERQRDFELNQRKGFQSGRTWPCAKLRRGGGEYAQSSHGGLWRCHSRLGLW